MRELVCARLTEIGAMEHELRGAVDQPRHLRQNNTELVCRAISEIEQECENTGGGQEKKRGSDLTRAKIMTEKEADQPERQDAQECGLIEQQEQRAGHGRFTRRVTVPPRLGSEQCDTAHPGGRRD